MLNIENINLIVFITLNIQFNCQLHCHKSRKLLFNRYLSLEKLFLKQFT